MRSSQGPRRTHHHWTTVRVRTPFKTPIWELAHVLRSLAVPFSCGPCLSFPHTYQPSLEISKCSPCKKSLISTLPTSSASAGHCTCVPSTHRVTHCAKHIINNRLGPQTTRLFPILFMRRSRLEKGKELLSR